MEKELNRCYKQNPDVVFRKVAGEYLLVPIKRKAVDIQSIYALNETGARSWELIDGKRDLREIAQLITEEFRVELNKAASDLIELIEGLEKTDLVSQVKIK
jgi:hypothetical protein